MNRVPSVRWIALAVSLLLAVALCAACESQRMAVNAEAARSFYDTTVPEYLQLVRESPRFQGEANALEVAARQLKCDTFNTWIRSLEALAAAGGAK